MEVTPATCTPFAIDVSGTPDLYDGRGGAVPGLKVTALNSCVITRAATSPRGLLGAVVFGRRPVRLHTGVFLVEKYKSQSSVREGT